MPNAKALEYYLSATFLDPHFFVSEHAERRIGTISSALADKKYEALAKAGKKPDAIARDEHPMVVGRVLDAMSDNETMPGNPGADSTTAVHDI